MRTPHKHAELIKAWADGAEIQFNQGSGHWLTITTPLWDQYDVGMFRIKPKTTRYRVALFKGGEVSLTQHKEIAICWEMSLYFIKWISDWQEVEV